MNKQLTSTKHNNLVDAYFFKGLSGVEIRILNLAIAQLNPMRGGEQNKRFEFTVQEFLSMNKGLKNSTFAYESVKKAVLNLSKIWVPVKPLEGFSNTEVALITRRSYSDGEGRFMIEFHDDVMPYLVKIKQNYTSILIETFGALRSEYALKLYEFFSRWAFRGEVQLSVDELRELLNTCDRYRIFNDFKRYAIGVGIDEINQKTDLNVDFEPIRTGRSITEIKFRISRKKTTVKISNNRPKFPHKNEYGNFVKLDKQAPKMSSSDYGRYAHDCLNILEGWYSNIDAVSIQDLRNYWVFLAVNESHKSKLGNKQDFLNEIKKRGYKLVNCELQEGEQLELPIKIRA